MRCGDGDGKRVPDFRVEVAEGALFQVVDFGLGPGKETAQNHRCHTLWVRQRIGERQAGAPRPAHKRDLREAQRVQHARDVLDEGAGGILRQRPSGRTLAGAALVEEDDVVTRAIKQVFGAGAAAAARPAMQEQEGAPRGSMAPLLYIELVAVADGQHVFVDGMCVGCHRMPFSGFCPRVAHAACARA